MIVLWALGFASLGAWVWLLTARGGFWRAEIREAQLASPSALGNHEDTAPPPMVAVVMPARNEAEFVGRAIAAVLGQDYGGALQILLVDDQSDDGTAEVARAAAARAGRAGSLTIVSGTAPPPGWTGKVWAMAQGVAALEREADAKPEFILFLDADIRLGAGVVARLVSGARRRGAVLVSLMALLRCANAAERLLAPAFVFFFQKLYPFAWVNEPGRSTAAAAGGCMLVDRRALADAGGIEAIRGAIIDDCALGALMKRQGPIWLGLAETVESLRGYPSARDFGQMVARSAYAELDYSPVRLAGTLIGMTVLYLVPPLLGVFGPGRAWIPGMAAWGLMAFAYVPTLDLYRVNRLHALALPAIAARYTGFTLRSAVQHWRGRGGAWKGRYQAAVGGRAVR